MYGHVIVKGTAVTGCRVPLAHVADYGGVCVFVQADGDWAAASFWDDPKANAPALPVSDVNFGGYLGTGSLTRYTTRIGTGPSPTRAWASGKRWRTAASAPPRTGPQCDVTGRRPSGASPPGKTCSPARPSVKHIHKALRRYLAWRARQESRGPVQQHRGRWVLSVSEERGD